MKLFLGEVATVGSSWRCSENVPRFADITLPVLGTVLLLLVTWEWCWHSRFTYLSQHYFLSSQPGFITGPSFLKCKLFTAKSHLIIVQWHLSQNVAFPAFSITCLEEPSDIFLHSFHLPALLEKQPDLHICLPHSAYPVPGSGWAADLCPQTHFCIQLIWITPRTVLLSPLLFSLHIPFFFFCLFSLSTGADRTFSRCSSVGFQRPGFHSSPTISATCSPSWNISIHLVSHRKKQSNEEGHKYARIQCSDSAVN